MTTKKDMAAYDKYNEAMSAFLFKNPFYFYWVSQTEYKEVQEDDTINFTGMQPNFSDNAYKLKVDSDRFPKLELPGRMFSLARNVLNMVYLHGVSDYAHHNLWPLSAELANVTKLLANGMKMPADPDKNDGSEPAFITPEFAAETFEKIWQMVEQQTGQPRPAHVQKPVQPPVGTKPAEFYFKWALDNAPPGQGGNAPQMSGGLPPDAQEMMDNLLDKAGDDFAPMTPEQKEMMQTMAGEMAQEATTHAGQPPGFMAGQLEDLIKALKPKVRWQDKLTNFTGQLGRMEIKPSHARENKYGQVPRISLKPNKKLLVAIDTSGSVSDQLLAQFLAELEAIAGHTDVDLMFVDYGVQEVVPFRKASDGQYKVKGRGGTDMREIFRWVRENRYQVDGIIVCTDGYTPFPTREERCGVKTLWLISEANIQAPQEAGETVHWDDNSKKATA